MDKWEYVEDKINIKETHISILKIMEMRELAGWFCWCAERKKDIVTLKFKRKIQQENGNK